MNHVLLFFHTKNQESLIIIRIGQTICYSEKLAVVVRTTFLKIKITFLKVARNGLKNCFKLMFELVSLLMGKVLIFSKNLTFLS